jgi:hypothetical protein
MTCLLAEPELLGELLGKASRAQFTAKNHSEVQKSPFFCDFTHHLLSL